MHQTKDLVPHTTKRTGTSIHWGCLNGFFFDMLNSWSWLVRDTSPWLADLTLQWVGRRLCGAASLCPMMGVSGLEPLLEVRVLGNMFVNRGMYYSANLLANVIRCFFIRGYSKTSVSSGLGHDFKEEISYFHWWIPPWNPIKVASFVLFNRSLEKTSHCESVTHLR